jgi:hypothetical protein
MYMHVVATTRQEKFVVAVDDSVLAVNSAYRIVSGVESEVCTTMM